MYTISFSAILNRRMNLK